MADVIMRAMAPSDAEALPGAVCPPRLIKAVSLQHLEWTMFRQCGFVIEGISRGYALRDGADHDVYQKAYYCGPEA